MSLPMYQDLINHVLHGYNLHGHYQPRHIEAYMRLEHNTLDGLSPKQFHDEVLLGVECIKADGPDAAERCAMSFGL